MTISAFSVDAAGITLAGRIARPSGTPAGTIVAIHGGTYDSEYYDGGDDSLLALGPTCGYTVVALDRPGYGGSTQVPADRLGFSEQATILAAGVDAIAADNRGPVSLVGHSIGGMLAILTAAAASTPIAGIEVSGLGELWQPGLREMWGSMIGDATQIELPPEAHSGVMLGPAETQKSGAADLDAALLRPMPMPELRDVVAWSDRLPAAAAAISVPISLTLAEFDNIWQADASAQQALAAHFTASPRVEVGQFAGAGHSIELHANAGDYVSSQLDFIDSLR